MGINSRPQRKCNLQHGVLHARKVQVKVPRIPRLSTACLARARNLLWVLPLRVGTRVDGLTLDFIFLDLTFLDIDRSTIPQ